MGRTYGLPYQGSKSRIAEWVVDVLPASHTLVDLFAGGCAVTHAALISGKWERVIANDRGSAPQVFLDACNGEFDQWALVCDRDDFMALRDVDEAVALLYSFGNNGRDYLWSEPNAAVKVPAEKMLAAPSERERRTWFKAFIKALMRDFGSDDEINRQQGMERLERVQGLQGMVGLERVQGLTVTRGDYRDVDVPGGGDRLRRPPVPRHQHQEVRIVQLRRVRPVARRGGLPGLRLGVHGARGVRRDRVARECVLHERQRQVHAGRGADIRPGAVLREGR